MEEHSNSLSQSVYFVLKLSARWDVTVKNSFALISSFYYYRKFILDVALKQPFHRSET